MKRSKLREEFDSEHGILCPVRACELLLQMSEEEARDWASDFRWLLSETASALLQRETGAGWKKREAPEPLSRLMERRDALKRASQVVGWFAARKPDASGPVKFGWSLCKAGDEYDRETGLELAMKTPWALPLDGEDPGASPLESPKNVKRLSRKTEVGQSGSGLAVRIWPLTVLEQYALFKQRCAEHFKRH